MQLLRVSNYIGIKFIAVVKVEYIALKLEVIINIVNGNMQARHLQQNQSLESLDKIEKSLFDSVVHFKWTHSLQ